MKQGCFDFSIPFLLFYSCHAGVDYLSNLLGSAEYIQRFFIEEIFTFHLKYSERLQTPFHSTRRCFSVTRVRTGKIQR